MKKGFTLIELLAVIVILAIIALIATPIIINIINDSRESSYKRSIELYGDAVTNTVARAQINGEEFPDGVYTKVSDGRLCLDKDTTKKCIKVDVEGTAPEEYTMTVLNGKIKEQTIQLKPNSPSYTKTESGSYKQLTRYYSWPNSSNISNGLPSDAKTNLSEIDTHDHPFYLAFDSSDGTTIEAAYVCFKRNNKEYCLKNEVTYVNNQYIKDKSDYYETNVNIIKEAFPESVGKTYEQDHINYCIITDEIFECYTGNFNAAVTFSGYIAVGSGSFCRLFFDGSFDCSG